MTLFQLLKLSSVKREDDCCRWTGNNVVVVRSGRCVLFGVAEVNRRVFRQDRWSPDENLTRDLTNRKQVWSSFSSLPCCILNSNLLERIFFFTEFSINVLLRFMYHKRNFWSLWLKLFYILFIHPVFSNLSKTSYVFCLVIKSDRRISNSWTLWSRSSSK
jgi:hypothetical protein